MAITKITRTTNLRGAVNYFKGKPHAPNKYVLKRNLMVDSLNAPCHFSDFKAQAMKTLRDNPKVHKHSIQAIRKIISFDPKELDYRKPKDIRKACAITKYADAKQFPGTQVLISVQADNSKKHHVLHTHSIICARRFDTGVSNTHKSDFLHSAKYTNEACKHYNIKPTTKIHLSSDITNSAAIHIYRSGRFSYMFMTRKLVNDTLSVSNSLSEFEKNVINSGITPHLYRGSRRNPEHKYKIKEFDKPEPNISKRLVNDLRLDDGKYLHLRKHFSYTINYKNKPIKIRAKKLGSFVDKPSVLKEINGNHTASLERKRKFEAEAKAIKSNQKQNKPKDESISKPVIHPITLKEASPTIKNVKPKIKSVEYTPHFAPKIKSKPRIKPLHIITFHPKTNHARVQLRSLMQMLSSLRGNVSKQKRVARQGVIQQKIDKDTAKMLIIRESNNEAYQKIKLSNRQSMKQFNQDKEDYEAYEVKTRAANNLAKRQNAQRRRAEWLRNQGPQI